MAELAYIDRYILSQDAEWVNRVTQATAQVAFDLILEDHAAEGHSYEEAKRRQELAQRVIQLPEREGVRVAAILASVDLITDVMVETDGNVITLNNIADSALSTFISSNWSKLAGVGSVLPEQVAA